jgi:hypothetical protein
MGIPTVTASPAAFGTDANCIIGSGKCSYFHSANVRNAFLSLAFKE